MRRPTQDDTFSFGLWTMRWTARDRFDSASRTPQTRVRRGPSGGRVG